MQADIYSSARYGASSHAEILERLAAHVYGDPAWRRVPSWVHAAVVHAGNAAHDALYRPNVSGADLERMLDRARRGLDVEPLPYVRWAHFVDGVEVDTAALVDVQRAEGSDSPRCASRHVWNHRPDRAF